MTSGSSKKINGSAPRWRWGLPTSAPEQGSRSRKNGPSNRAPERSWDLFSAAVLVAAVFLETLQWPALPRSIDAFYHMAVAEGFREAGGYVTRAFWENAPSGRPHLYPPLIHVVLLALRALGLSAIDSARALEASLHPLGLAALWACVRRMSSPRVAFFATLLWTCSAAAYSAAFGLPAEALAFALGLGAYAAFEDGNRPLSVLLLALAFYAHALFPWTIAAALLTYGAVTGRPRGASLVVAAAVLAASPLLAHEAMNARYFDFVTVLGDYATGIDLTVATACFAGLVFAARRRVDATAALCLWLAASPLYWIHRARFLGGHGAAGAVWLAALALEAVYLRAEPRRLSGAFLALAAAWIVLASPVSRIEPGRRARFEWAGSTFARLLARPPDARPSGLYDERQVGRLADVVRSHSSEGEPLWADLRYGAALLSAVTGRPSTTSSFREVRGYAGGDPAASAKLAVCFKDGSGREPSWCASLATGHGFERVDETPWAVVYANPNSVPRVTPPKALVPSAALFAALGACAFCGAWCAIKRPGAPR